CTSFSYVLLRLNRRLQTESTSTSAVHEDVPRDAEGQGARQGAALRPRDRRRGASTRAQPLRVRQPVHRARARLPRHDQTTGRAPRPSRCSATCARCRTSC
ncbi:MAG: hypothetical protein MZW92_01840, partial [Comamonadaceae bacterium]|nr:hypothetical protein [Comamonadaceae bacterium]